MAKGRTPAPPAKLEVTTRVWEKGRPFHRIHHEDFDADQFNDSGKGDSRFSPIHDSDGNLIPTLYGGGSFACAVMEVPFHNVPFEPGFKTVDAGNLQGLQHSVVEPTSDLRLADFTNMPLRKMGIPRDQLIDTDQDQYEATRKWAEAVHAQDPDVQGLYWTSRQDDTQPALILFGDRVADGTLQQVGPSRSLLDDEDAHNELLDVAEKIGVQLVPGK